MRTRSPRTVQHCAKSGQACQPGSCRLSSGSAAKSKVWRAAHQAAVVEQQDVLVAAELGGHEIPVDVDGAELVLNHSDALPVVSLEDVVEERRLARTAEERGDISTVSCGASVGWPPELGKEREALLCLPRPEVGKTVMLDASTAEALCGLSEQRRQPNPAGVRRIPASDWLIAPGGELWPKNYRSLHRTCFGGEPEKNNSFARSQSRDESGRSLICHRRSSNEGALRGAALQRMGLGGGKALRCAGRLTQGSR